MISIVRLVGCRSNAKVWLHAVVVSVIVLLNPLLLAWMVFLTLVLCIWSSLHICYLHCNHIDSVATNEFMTETSCRQYVCFGKIAFVSASSYDYNDMHIYLYIITITGTGGGHRHNNNYYQRNARINKVDKSSNESHQTSSTIPIYDLLIHNKAFNSHIGAPFLW